MKVTCPSCAKRYKIDDSYIPASGARLRCPKCQELFNVYHEEAAEVSEATICEEVGVASGLQGDETSLPYDPSYDIEEPEDDLEELERTQVHSGIEEKPSTNRIDSDSSSTNIRNNERSMNDVEVPTELNTKLPFDEDSKVEESESSEPIGSDQGADILSDELPGELSRVAFGSSNISDPSFMSDPPPESDIQSEVVGKRSVDSLDAKTEAMASEEELKKAKQKPVARIRSMDSQTGTRPTDLSFGSLDGSFDVETAQRKKKSRSRDFTIPKYALLIGVPILVGGIAAGIIRMVLSPGEDTLEPKSKVASVDAEQEGVTEPERNHPYAKALELSAVLASEMSLQSLDEAQERLGKLVRKASKSKRLSKNEKAGIYGALAWSHALESIHYQEESASGKAYQFAALGLSLDKDDMESNLALVALLAESGDPDFEGKRNALRKLSKPISRSRLDYLTALFKRASNSRRNAISLARKSVKGDPEFLPAQMLLEELFRANGDNTAAATTKLAIKKQRNLTKRSFPKLFAAPSQDKGSRSAARDPRKKQATKKAAYNKKASAKKSSGPKRSAKKPKKDPVQQLIQRGDRYFAKQQFQLAQKNYLKAQNKLQKESPITLSKLGMTWLKLYRPDKAYKHFKRAIDLDSDYAEAHRGLGRVYEHLGDKKKATREYKLYLQLDPDADDSAAIRKRILRLNP